MLPVMNGVAPNRKLISNKRNGSLYQMLRADQVDRSDMQFDNLVTVCNQPSIFNRLFKERLQGRGYELRDAQRFLDWAASGWESQTHYVFFLTDRAGLIVGTLDIKSADRDAALIGYWCSEAHRGLMTGALGAMLDFAKQAGYRKLCAEVRNDNHPSIRVLERNGFCIGNAQTANPGRLAYEMQLN